MILEYNIPLQIGNRTFKVRKWKVKDRDKFKELYKNTQTQNDVNNITYETLLMPSFEKEPALNMDEREYALAMLRKINIGEQTEYSYFCPSCGKQTSAKLKIDDIFDVKSGKIENINVENINIELQDVVNPAYYNEKIQKTDSPLLVDFILHIKSINGDNTKGFDDLLNYFSEQDVDLVDKILDKFEEMTFRITNRIKTLTCTKCKQKTDFDFDRIPNLIPEKWLKR